MKVLGIESSCDETAVAIVDDQKNILSHIVKSQIQLHKKYGGVVPELAARSHIEVIDKLILEALKQANLDLKEIDGFAATSGPGLIGSVIVGMMAAKTLASIFKKPFLAINHLEGHALTVRLTHNIEFPYLLLLLSGGHCQILLAKGVDNYQKIGETLDDALGETFDKVAQMLGLNYPGGPEVEKLALGGNENRFKFCQPLIGSRKEEHFFNFSFSGLKTAVRREIEKLIGENFSHLTSPQKITKKDCSDICASFQKVICEIIISRLENIFKDDFLTVKIPNSIQYSDDAINLKSVVESNLIDHMVIAGGVAANRYIFDKLEKWAKKYKIKILTPPLSLCTDNAAMIAWTGIEKLRLKKIDSLNFKPMAKWSLQKTDCA